MVNGYKLLIKILLDHLNQVLYLEGLSHKVITTSGLGITEEEIAQAEDVELE